MEHAGSGNVDNLLEISQLGRRRSPPLPPTVPAVQEADRSGQLKEMTPCSITVSLSITKPLVHFNYFH
ncbi:hypothetical protein ILYODFUR_016064 [Ilyodon furcidens]|uniref:Uncharacterized protein n=1 Tax=Ilyodon furcidens TaxID=33524 RepID=A0ABV0UJA4_9TELE